jgi:hypothetical protein
LIRGNFIWVGCHGNAPCMRDATLFYRAARSISAFPLAGETSFAYNLESAKARLH